MATGIGHANTKWDEARLPQIYFLGGYHPSNESFIRSPPENVKIRSRVPVEEFDNFGKLKQYSGTWPLIKRFTDSTYRALRIPRVLPVLGKHDLIHTNGSVIPLSRKPWVASMENPSAFYGFREYWHQKKSIKKILAEFLLSDRCRAVLPYSNASKGYLLACLDEWRDEIEKKTEVLNLAIDSYLIRKDDKPTATNDRPVRFLFVGTHFFDKGGREVVRAFRQVRECGPCELTVVTAAPPHQRREFENFLPILMKEKNVSYHPTGIPRRKLLELYRTSDVFVFPSYMDQVPFVLIEAMASGLPLIGSNSYAVPEMVMEGENGFVVESPWVAFPADRPRTEGRIKAYREAVLDEHNFDGVVEQLVNSMTRLVRDSRLRDRLGRNSLRLVREGKFSVAVRNRQLSSVYERAIGKSTR